MKHYVHCIECDLLIPQQAKSCPRCGIRNDFRKKNRFLQLIAYVLTMSILFSACFVAGCYFRQWRLERPEPVSESRELLFASDPEVTARLLPLNRVQVQEGPLVTTLTLPASLAGDLSGFDPISYAWEHKYLRAAVEEDMLSLTMLPHRYDSILESVTAWAEEEFSALQEAGPFAESITHSFTFDTVTIPVSGEPGMDPAWIQEIGLTAMTCQAFLDQPYGAVLTIVDSASGEILDTFDFPAYLNAAEAPSLPESSPAEMMGAVLPETAEPAAEPVYSLTPMDVLIWQDPLGNSWAQVLFQVKNLDHRDLYIGPGSYTLVDASGDLFSTQYHTAVSHPILSPGETGYLYNQIQLERPPETALTAVPKEIPIYPAEQEQIRFSVSQTRLYDNEYGELRMSGSVTNASAREYRMVDVCVLLFNDADVCIGALSEILSRLPGESTVSFDAAAYALPTWINAATVSYCQVIASVFQYQQHPNLLSPS